MRDKLQSLFVEIVANERYKFAVVRNSCKISICNCEELITLVTLMTKSVCE